MAVSYLEIAMSMYASCALLKSLESNPRLRIEFPHAISENAISISDIFGIMPKNLIVRDRDSICRAVTLTIPLAASVFQGRSYEEIATALGALLYTTRIHLEVVIDTATAFGERIMRCGGRATPMFGAFLPVMRQDSDVLPIVEMHVPGTEDSANPKTLLWLSLSSVTVRNEDQTIRRAVVPPAPTQEAIVALMQAALVVEFKHQRTMNGYVTACRNMYMNLKSTWPATERIHCLAYRAGMLALPSLAYTTPVEPPYVSIDYFKHALDLVLGRERTSMDEFMALRHTSTRAASIAAQVITMYAWHCTYAADEADVPATAWQASKVFDGALYHDKRGGVHPFMQPTINVSQDELFNPNLAISNVPIEMFYVAARLHADDCEGLSELTLQLQYSLLYYLRDINTVRKDASYFGVIKLRQILSLYVFSIALMGVTSGDIAGDYNAIKDASSMGAHMAAVAVSKDLFYKLMRRTNVSKKLFEPALDNDERAQTEVSKQCESKIVMLEGTGPLLPTAHVLSSNPQLLLPVEMLALDRTSPPHQKHIALAAADVAGLEARVLGAGAVHTLGNTDDGNGDDTSRVSTLSVNQPPNPRQSNFGNRVSTRVDTRVERRIGASSSAYNFGSAPIEMIQFVSGRDGQAVGNMASPGFSPTNECTTSNSLFISNMLRSMFPNAFGHLPRWYHWTPDPALDTYFYRTVQSLYTPHLMRMGYPAGAFAVVYRSPPESGKRITYGVTFKDFVNADADDASTVSLWSEPPLEPHEVESMRVLREQTPRVPPLYAAPKEAPTKKAVFEDQWLASNYPLSFCDTQTYVLTKETSDEYRAGLSNIANTARASGVRSLLKQIYLGYFRSDVTVCTLDRMHLATDKLVPTLDGDRALLADARFMLEKIAGSKLVTTADVAAALASAHAKLVYRKPALLPTTATYFIRYNMLAPERMRAMDDAVKRSIALKVSTHPDVTVFLEPSSAVFHHEQSAADLGLYRSHIRFYQYAVIPRIKLTNE